jgi:beta-lactamase class A
VQDGKLSLDTKLPITAADRDSSSGSLWAKKNIIMLSVRELLYYMLAESDNTATWVLQNPMTKEDIEQLTNYVGYYSNDIKSQELPLKTTEITPKSVANIFSSLYLSTVLNPEYSELILSDMTNSSFDIKKYAQLPEKVVISQKHGFHYLDDGSFYHSCGIIYVEDSRFFYCVMTQDISDEKAPEVIGTIVNKLYNFILEGRKVKDINI